MSVSSHQVWSPSVFSDDSIGYREGLHFRIVQIVGNLQRKNAMIFEDDLAAKENVYPVLFDKDDVDFEIRIENDLPSNVVCGVNIGHMRNRYIVKSGGKASLKALESNGKHLHFVSQGTMDGRLMVAMSARANGTTYEEAVVNCSRIEFDVEVEKDENEIREEKLWKKECFARRSPTMVVRIKELTGREFTLGLCPQDRVELLRLMIEEKVGVPPDQQRLIYDAKQLADEDDRTVGDIGMRDGSVIHLVLRLRGGGMGIQAVHDVGARGGERGVVCFGNKTNQQFSFYDKRFIASKMYSLKGFTLELRTKPTYSLCP